MKTTIAALVSVIALSSSPLLAQSPFDGTWVMNQEKSDFTGQTMTIEDAGNGAIKFVNPTFSYTVKTDGTKAETPAGTTVAMRKQADGSYHETEWRDGKELSQSDWKLSDADKTLTIHEFGTRPDGEKFDNTSTYTRVSGTTGLPGEWKTSAVKLGNPTTYRISMGTGDQMTWDLPALKATWRGKTDGADVRPTGPTVPDTLTLAVTRQGPRALSMTQKLQGKTVYTGTYTVSEDGKTMTVVGKNAKGESSKQVWERQGS
jgi:hypothetical protein